MSIFPLSTSLFPSILTVSDLANLYPSLSPLMIQLGLVGLWLGAVALFTLIAKRWNAKAPEVLRKIIHIGTGNVILLAWWMQMPAWVGIAASVLFSGITLLSYRFPLLPLIDSVGRKSLGTSFYAISIGILIATFWPIGMPYYAVIGVLVMTWGDGMAALVGQRWGRHSFEVWGMKKSWEGSLAMAIASYAVSSLTLLGVQGAIPATWGVALAIALFATLLEWFSTLGIDNLTVPLGSGAIAFCLNHLWLGF